MHAVPLIPLVVALVLVVVPGGWVRLHAWAWKAQLALAAVMVVSGSVLGLTWAPPDRFMGDIQRIMYVHVPQVWVAMLAVTVFFAASIVQLWGSSQRADALADASAEVGLVFGVIGLGLGALWGRTTWGVWWSWDPRMTATVAMLGLLAAALVARRSVRDPNRRALVSAAGAACVAVALPVVYYSVVWWSSLHQLPSTSKTMDPAITLTLRWNAVAFFCLFLVLVKRRAQLTLPRA